MVLVVGFGSCFVVVVVHGVVCEVAAVGGVVIRIIVAKRRAGELLGPVLAGDLKAAPDPARARAVNSKDMIVHGAALLRSS